MSIEQVLSAVAATAAPIIGLALQASRRNRLLRRIDSYVKLSDRLTEYDRETAAELRALIRETTLVLVQRDRRVLHQRIDPGTVLAILFLAIPAGFGVIFALRWDSGWRWPLVVILCIWIVLWTGVGLTQLRTEEAEGKDDKG